MHALVRVCVCVCLFELEAKRAFSCGEGREPVHQERLKIQEHG